MMGRDRHAAAYLEAVRAVGARSGAAQLHQAAVARLDELIQERRSPHGVAKENLGKILQRAKQDPRAVSDRYLNAAVSELLDTAKNVHAGGGWQHGDDQATRLLVESARVWSQRKKADLEKLISKARHPGSDVTDGQFGEAMAAVFAADRQRARLKDDEQLPGPGTFALVGEALRIIHARRREAFRELIEKAQRPGEIVTDEQFHDGACGLLESGRAEAFGGIEDVDANGPGTFALIMQANEIALYRHKVELHRLLEEAKRPGGIVTPEQISNEVKKVLAYERGKQLFGGPDDAPSGREIWKLMEEAAEVYDQLSKAPAKPPVRHTQPQKHLLRVAPLR
jgi:hypothetical protein